MKTLLKELKRVEEKIQREKCLFAKKEHYTIEEVLEYNEITRIIEKIRALEIAIEKREYYL